MIVGMGVGMGMVGVAGGEALVHEVVLVVGPHAAKGQPVGSAWGVGGGCEPGGVVGGVMVAVVVVVVGRLVRVAVVAVGGTGPDGVSRQNGGGPRCGVGGGCGGVTGVG